MSLDIAVSALNDGSFRSDFQVLMGDLVSEQGLRTSCYISLFTDRRVEFSEIPDGENSPRGWWGDVFPSVDADQIGSRLWLLKREKRTVETLNRAEDYSKEALQWMVDDGVSSSVDVDAEYDVNGYMIISISIFDENGNVTGFKFKSPWAVEFARGNN